MGARAKSELPDVPEAAVEAAADALTLNRITATDLRTGKPIALPDNHVIVRIYGAARAVLDAALPVLIEQGWTPPGEDAR